MTGLVASLVLIYVMGVPLAACVCTSRSWSDRILRPVLAYAIGMGMCSCIFFLSMVAFGSAGRGFQILECAVLLGVIIAGNDHS